MNFLPSSASVPLAVVLSLLLLPLSSSGPQDLRAVILSEVEGSLFV
jgi:hypothetical protein